MPNKPQEPSESPKPTNGSHTSTDQKTLTPAEAQAAALAMPVMSASPLLDTAKFNQLWRVANAFAESDLVPKQFYKKPANVFIVLQSAVRTDLDPFFVLQKSYVIGGKPAVESQVIIAMLEASGRIRGPIRYVFDGEGDDYGCMAVVMDAAADMEIHGPKITKRLVKAEGWDSKTGSKWRTMPEKMFRYRAACWLVDTQYPSVKFGLQSMEELQDANTVDATATERPRTLEDLTHVTIEQENKTSTPGELFETSGDAAAE